MPPATKSEKPTETGLGPVTQRDPTPPPMSERTITKTVPGGFTSKDGPPSSSPTIVRRALHPDTIKDINVEVKRCLDCGARFGIDATFCPFDGTGLTTATWDPTGDPLAGKIIEGRYRVEGPLGEGGMGTVYRVRHVTLNRAFALKVLRRDLASDTELATRFMQEAKATAAIKHPSVVAINDFGELEDGIPYFVMELLDGETLATRLRARGPMVPRTAIRIARKIAEGLVASHQANVIHRDLKPENVFLVGASAGKEPEDEIRIVDFGAAKIIGGSKLTRPGIVFGTPYYMSPEQASGQTIDARADVYSLGVLLYEMITGNVPFEADTYMGVLTKHMFADPIKPSEKVRPGIQLGMLEEIILKALAKDPADRYPSMNALALALDDAEEKRRSNPPKAQLPARMTLPLGSMSAADRLQVSIRRREVEEAQRKRRLLGVAIVAAFGTLALGLGISAVVTSRSPAPASATTSTTSAPRATVTEVPSTSSDPRSEIPPPPEVASSSSSAETDESTSSSTQYVSVPTSSAKRPPLTISGPPARPKPTVSTAAPAATTSTAPKPTATPTQPVHDPSQHRPDDFKDPWK